MEKMPVTFFTSTALTSNHYVFFVPKCWKHAVTAAIKYETATSLTYLVDSTAIDTYSYDIFNKFEDHSVEFTRMLRFDNYYSLFNRTRYTIIEAITKTPLKTAAFFFKNAVWLEREFLEMYGPAFSTTYDTRNLLLEYSFTENPMLKTYPSEGFSDVYYDFFRDQLCYVDHDFVEL